MKTRKTFKRFIISIGIISMAVLALQCKKMDDVKPENDLSTFEGVIKSGGTFEQVASADETDIVDVTEDTLINGDAWKCTTTNHKVTDGIGGQEGFPLFNPNASVIYPGSLLQGSSLKKSTPDIIAVERGGGVISIDINDGNKQASFEVDQVKKSSIASAQNAIISESSGIVPSNFVLTKVSVESRQKLALALGVDVNTAFVDVESKLKFNSDKAYNSLLVKLTQSFYTMSFDIPTSPEDLFAAEVTPADLTKYVYPGNPATYISDVTFGRIYYMLVESTSSSTDLESKIEASFNGIGSDVDVDASASYVKELKNVKIQVLALGGESSSTVSTIGDNNIKDLIKNIAEGSDIRSGVPLSYVVRSVYDNEIVSVKTATEYDVTNCEPLNLQPGLFNFLSKQSSPVSISTPVNNVFMADMDGDDNDDLVLNYLGPSGNQILIGYSDGLGNFEFDKVYQNDYTPAEGWSQYMVQPADLNGDGKKDLVWNYKDWDNNTYLAITQEDGSFEFSDLIQHPNHGWSKFLPYFRIGKFNNDNTDDLLWSSVDGINRSYIALSQADSTVQLNLLHYQDLSSTWTYYQTYVGDITGDGLDDIMWIDYLNPTNRNTTWAGIMHDDGTFTKGPTTSNFTSKNSDWKKTSAFVGDVNGDNLEDLFWIDAENAKAYVSHSDGDGTFTYKGTQNFEQKLDSVKYKAYSGDIDGDGATDLIMNSLESNNLVVVGLGGSSDGMFNFTTQKQMHPANASWKQFEDNVFVNDISGDGKDDIIWVRPGATVEIYVGLSQ